MTDIEEFMIDNNVTQLTRIWEMDGDGLQITTGWSVVKGNDRYFGASILEALEKAR